MAHTTYRLEDDSILVVIQDAVIGKPQLSVITYIGKQIRENEELSGELIEGRWFVIPNHEQLGKEISKLLNQDKQIRITIKGQEIISSDKIVNDVIALLERYGLYDMSAIEEKGMIEVRK